MMKDGISTMYMQVKGYCPFGIISHINDPYRFGTVRKQFGWPKSDLLHGTLEKFSRRQSSDEPQTLFCPFIGEAQLGNMKIILPIPWCGYVRICVYMRVCMKWGMMESTMANLAEMRKSKSKYRRRRSTLTVQLLNKRFLSKNEG